MIFLVAGLMLWWGAHLFKRIAPGPRATLAARLGDRSKGVFAITLLLATALMVIGYRQADFTPLWDPPEFLRHINNLMMLVSVALFGTGNSKSRLRGRLRHPMLLGFITWALAHLLVNGDLASLVLFGGLGAWAVAAILAINAQDRIWVPWTGGTPAGDARLAIIAIVATGVIGLVHGWIGPSPFGG